jgi:hypothetical protein
MGSPGKKYTTAAGKTTDAIFVIGHLRKFPVNKTKAEKLGKSNLKLVAGQ